MGDSAQIRVMLVDDHALFRRGLASLLRDESKFEVVGEAGDGVEAISRALALRPDVILMDVRMPRMGGPQATREILAALPQTRVLMLSMSDEEDVVLEAVRNGAGGYLLKTAEPEEFFAAVRGIVRGEAPLSSGLAVKLLREFARRGKAPAETAPLPPVLSPHEKDVLALVADGKSNKEIATVLAVSENTVKNEIKKIRQKLHLENRVQTAVFALSEDAVSFRAA